jgi:RNA-binding protein YhbY
MCSTSMMNGMTSERPVREMELLCQRLLVRIEVVEVSVIGRVLLLFRSSLLRIGR